MAAASACTAAGEPLLGLGAEHGHRLAGEQLEQPQPLGRELALEAASDDQALRAAGVQQRHDGVGRRRARRGGSACSRRRAWRAGRPATAARSRRARAARAARGRRRSATREGRAPASSRRAARRPCARASPSPSSSYSATSSAPIARRRRRAGSRAASRGRTPSAATISQNSRMHRLGRAGAGVDELELLLEAGAGHRDALLAGALGQQQRAVGAVEQLVGGQRSLPLGERRSSRRTGASPRCGRRRRGRRRRRRRGAARRTRRRRSARRRRGRAARRAWPRPPRAASSSPGQVAALVVDGLEVVEVEQQAGQRVAGAARSGRSPRGRAGAARRG